MQQEKDLLTQFEQIRELCKNAGVTDVKTLEHYAWIMVKVLHSDLFGNDAVRPRQYLAEYLSLPLPRPSAVHSAMLGCACSMAARYPAFHFAPFLKMWGTQHLRAEDFQAGMAADGKVFPSLAEKVVREYVHALLLRPDERLTAEELDVLRPTVAKMRYYAARPMIVSRVTQGSDGHRSFYFAELVDAKGLKVSCEAHSLTPHPLAAATDKRHYVNVGQVYDVLLREKKKASDDGEKLRVDLAYLSLRPWGEGYPVVTGYVDSYDAGHQYYHIFDAASRHFVASAADQRLGCYGRPTIAPGDFVRFAPIIPAPRVEGGKSFKTAYVIEKLTTEAGPSGFGLRRARVTMVDAERKFYRWELTDAAHPIVETLDNGEPAAGEGSTSGFVHFGDEHGPHHDGTPVPAVGSEINVVVFLRRGKDGQKRPKVVLVSI